VSDLADAHVKALERISGAAGAPGAVVSGAYNLGTGAPQSVRDVIAAVERISGRTVARTAAARRPGDPAILFAAADKARADLGWTPRFPDLDAIVRTAWQWRQTHPQGYRTAGRP
jgi:UDP-glucose 4-epimerase